MLNIVILSKSHLKKLKEYKLALILIIAVVFTSFSQNPVGIGTVAPDQSAILDVNSEDKGFLPPRMLEEQMEEDIISPASGLMVYCTSCSPEGIYVYDGDEFRQLKFLGKPVEALSVLPRIEIIQGRTSFDISPTLTPSDATVYYNLACNAPSGVSIRGGVATITLPTDIELGEYEITVKATGNRDYTREVETTFILNIIADPDGG